MNQRRIPAAVLKNERLKKTDSVWRRLRTSQRFLSLVGLFFLVLMAFPLAKTYSQRRAVEQEIADVQAEIKNYEEQTAEFNELISYLNTKQSLEEQARLNLNLKKPNEQVLVISETKTETPAEASVSSSEECSNFQKWLDYFFSR